MRQLSVAQACYIGGSQMQEVGKRHFSSNVYLLMDSGECALIDAGGGQVSVSRLQRRMSADGLRLRWIILTHYHYDHVRNAQSIQNEFPAAETVCHRRDAPFIRRPSCILDGTFTNRWLGGSLHETFRQMNRCIGEYEEYRRQFIEIYQSAAVDWVICRPTPLRLGNLWLHLLPTPGHSPGSLSIWVPEHRLVFCGDLPLWCGPAQPHPFGNYRRWRESLHQIRGLQPACLAWGHSVPTEGTDRCRRLIDRVLDHARSMTQNLVRCLDRRGRTVSELAPAVADERMLQSPGQRRLIEDSVHSMLHWLKDEGKATCRTGYSAVQWFAE